MSLHVYVVEVTDDTTDATLGFYPITTTSTDGLAALAGELCEALGHGVPAIEATWRMVADHPFTPRETGTIPEQRAGE